MHEKQTRNISNLTAPSLEKWSNNSPTAEEQGLALREQRRVTSWGKERRGETEELKGHQQQEPEGSHLPLMGCTGASLQV